MSQVERTMIVNGMKLIWSPNGCIFSGDDELQDDSDEEIVSSPAPPSEPTPNRMQANSLPPTPLANQSLPTNQSTPTNQPTNQPTIQPANQSLPMNQRRQDYYLSLVNRNYNGATYIDSHCHIDDVFFSENFTGTWTEFKEKKRATWAKCYEGCIADFCCPRFFMKRDPLWLKLLQEPDIWGAFGCHPKHYADYNPMVETFIANRMRHEKVLAWGEIGLDYYHVTVPKCRDEQKTVFKRQLQQAVQCGKPVVIHCRDGDNSRRDAENDCRQIMMAELPREHSIHRHCFTGTCYEAKLLTDHFPNLKLGLTPRVYSDSGWRNEELLRHIPLEKVLIETDAPHFNPFCSRIREAGTKSPPGFPGQAYVVAVRLAEERTEGVTQILKQIRQNTRDVYGI